MASHFLKTHHALPATSFPRQCLHGRDGHAPLALARFGRLGGRPSNFLCTSGFLKLWILSRGIGEAIFGIFEALFDLLPGELFGVSIGKEVVRSAAMPIDINKLLESFRRNLIPVELREMKVVGVKIF